MARDTDKAAVKRQGPPLRKRKSYSLGESLLRRVKRDFCLWRRADFAGKVWGLGLWLAPIFAGFSFMFGINLPHWAKQGIIALWTVGVPMWFLFEWQTKEARLTDQQIARFKYTQELASKVWIAVLGLLIVSYFPDVPSSIFKSHSAEKSHLVVMPLER